MTIKTQIHSAHEQIQKSCNTVIKRSHFYELLAAAFGFKTHASFINKSIFIYSKNLLALNQFDKELLKKRSLELGYDLAISIQLMRILRLNGISIINYSALIKQFRMKDEDVNYFDLDELEQVVNPEMLTALINAAGENSAFANYCLALHYRKTTLDSEGSGSLFWYEQMKSGRELSGAEKEWASIYQEQLEAKANHDKHLYAAAKLGCELALLDLADMNEDPTFFDNEINVIDVDPMYVAKIAEKLGRPQDVHKWLTAAAMQGDIHAMRELIVSFDKEDLVKCWVWVSLSQLLNADLTQDKHYAIHEDGSDYDEDVGGPMYAGGDVGIILADINHHEKKQATVQALSIYNDLK